MLPLLWHSGKYHQTGGTYYQIEIKIIYIQSLIIAINLLILITKDNHHWLGENGRLHFFFLQVYLCTYV